ncbi:histidine kinase [Synechococcus sp. PCC 7502]|uniref:sensor histidine kinase n=1 Tax=Synechococcus sp. PCC 7502 TaxID=1173263 RepID=UPI00029FD281|nr:ATP-binding protein [Synechococcus sp. PCC 7502]AFY74108.1 histidine kinase [Synechococcus sp. PCC 7502]
MILSKLYMGWDTALSRVFKRIKYKYYSVGKTRSLYPKIPFLSNLTWGLLLPYTFTMLAIMGVSAIAVYQFFAQNLYRELDQELSTLATAAAHSLPNALSGKMSKNLVVTQTLHNLDNDGELEIPWQDLRRNHQTVEWFDSQGKQLASTGERIPSRPLGKSLQTFQENGLRSLTMPVYMSSSKPPKQVLYGYVRVSIPTADELSRLLMGLQIGGGISLVLIASTGLWLTQRSLQPIEKSIRQLQQFTADASHELRSPLTAIRTAVEVIQSHPERVHASYVNKLEAIVSATHQMGQLVEDLLLLDRMDTHPLAPIAITIPVDEVLEDLLELLEPMAIAKHISLQSQGQWSGDFGVQGDASNLRRLLLNLIDNAIKYTPSGGEVRVSLLKTDTVITIKVEDTGIGIAPNQINRVFDRFWRADQARSYFEEGSGLGLAIAQAIARMHKGEIFVSSQLNVGSCFTLVLPSA